MPELPEVEVLVRHLRPLLRGKTVRGVDVRRGKVLGATSVARFRRTLRGATFGDLGRRGKYLVFRLERPDSGKQPTLLGHLGMAGRMFVARKGEPLPRHAAVVLDLGRENFIYEDRRYFGRLTLNLGALEKLGPEPLDTELPPAEFVAALRKSRQAIKVRLLDQAVVAGVGNIYASEALFVAGISPRLPACRLSDAQVKRLWQAIRTVLSEAVAGGSTVPLSFGGSKSDGLFYFGRAPGALDFYEERLRVYDRVGRPCVVCDGPIRRLVQVGRSTFYCPHCQRQRPSRIRPAGPDAAASIRY